LWSYIFLLSPPNCGGALPLEVNGIMNRPTYAAYPTVYAYFAPYYVSPSTYAYYDPTARGPKIYGPYGPYAYGPY